MFNLLSYYLNNKAIKRFGALFDMCFSLQSLNHEPAICISFYLQKNRHKLWTCAGYMSTYGSFQSAPKLEKQLLNSCAAGSPPL